MFKVIGKTGRYGIGTNAFGGAALFVDSTPETDIWAEAHNLKKRYDNTYRISERLVRAVGGFPVDGGENPLYMGAMQRAQITPSEFKALRLFSW